MQPHWQAPQGKAGCPGKTVNEKKVWLGALFLPGNIHQEEYSKAQTDHLNQGYLRIAVSRLGANKSMLSSYSEDSNFMLCQDKGANQGNQKGTQSDARNGAER